MSWADGHGGTSIDSHEIDPHYASVVLARWEAFSDKEAEYLSRS
jgi:hypothetical protein